MGRHKVLAASGLAAVMVAAVGMVSSAQAAVIDFAVGASGGTLAFTGTSLQSSTAFDLDTSTLSVTNVGALDASGLAVGDPITIVPTNIAYGAGSGKSTLATPVLKSWTDGSGIFDEDLTTVELVNRSSANAITVDLSGTLTGGPFVSAPAFLILSATQAGGPGTSISVSLTETSSNPAPPTIPEPSTWAMMLMGFAGLGFAAYRRGRKGDMSIVSS
jgi:PEP-CTERM motif